MNNWYHSGQIEDGNVGRNLIETCDLPVKFRDIEKSDYATFWCYLDLQILQRFQCYIGVYKGVERIIMPVYKRGQSVFFSARITEKEWQRAEGNPMVRKYETPYGVRKQYWISNENPSIFSTVFICEGVADSLYMSQFGTSIGLMGTVYDGSLDDFLKQVSKIVICFDNDLVGNLSSIKIAKYLSNITDKVKLLMLDKDRDPVDYTSYAMLKILSEYVSVPTKLSTTFMGD